MRANMKWVTNTDELKENAILRQNALLTKQQNPYSDIQVPKRIREEYALCPFSFKVANVLDFYVEPTEEKDIVVNFYPQKQLVFEYDPLLVNKLELVFNGE